VPRGSFGLSVVSLLSFDIMASSGDTGSMSWMSLLAASSQLMDQKIQSDATTDPGDEDSAVANLLCFENIGGESPDSTVIQQYQEAKKRKKDPLPIVKKYRSLKPLRYIRGIPAIR